MNGQGSNEIIRVKRLPSNFVQMHKAFLEDMNLSYKAKGILAYLLTKPDGWIARVSDLMKHGRDGRESIYNGLKELQEHGYYQKQQIRNDRGRFSHWESTICEIPIWKLDTRLKTSHPPNPGNPYADESLMNTGFSPDTGFPDTDNPNTAKPNPGNPSHSNNYPSNNDLSNNYINTPTHMGKAGLKRSPQSGHQQGESLTVNTARGAGIQPVNRSMTLVEQQYEQFWQSYPRKMGKKEGLKAWKRLCADDALFTAIMNALESSKQWWKSNRTETRYIPYPATWINGEHWKNEVVSSVESGHESTTGMSNQKKNRFHNFTERQYSKEHYEKMERIDRQRLLALLGEDSSSD